MTRTQTRVLLPGLKEIFTYSSVIPFILANIIPLLGVLFFGVVGIYNVCKIFY